MRDLEKFTDIGIFLHRKFEFLLEIKLTSVDRVQEQSWLAVKCYRLKTVNETLHTLQIYILYALKK